MGPAWYMLIDEKNSKINDIKITSLSSYILKEKLELHPYTVRKDALSNIFKNVDEMYDAVLNKAGSTGIFTDFPDTGVKFLEK